MNESHFYSGIIPWLEQVYSGIAQWLQQGIPANQNLGPVNWVLVTVLATALVNIAFAFGVYMDGRRMAKQKTKPLFVWPVIWALATLLGGMPIVALYWAIHYSTLRPHPSSDLPA